MTVYRWDTTAANNDDADSTINWVEGQAPSTLNNSARAMMAAVAKWRADESGNLLTGGTATAYTLTTNQVHNALTDGIYVTCRMSATSGATPTLNVDGLGAKSIAGVYGTAILTGALVSGSVHTFVYDSTDDKWIVHGRNQDFYIAGGTDVAIADGGTGVGTAAAAYDAFSIHGADVASAGTTNLTTATGNLVDITGTTTITAITLAEGLERTVRFTAALTLTHGSSLVLPGSANITTAAGDVAVFRGYAAGVVRCVQFQRLSWTTLFNEIKVLGTTVGTGVVRLADQTAMEAQTADRAVCADTLLFGPTVPKAWVQFNGSGVVAIGESFGMTSVTDLGTGNYRNNLSTAFAAATYSIAGSAASTSAIDGVMSNINSDTRSTTQCEIHTIGAATASAVDCIRCCTIFLGDQ